MGRSAKYGKVTVERERRDPIGEDEPVAVFRAKDEHAIPVLQYYLERCLHAECSTEHVIGVAEQILAFERFAEESGTRQPGANA